MSSLNRVIIVGFLGSDPEVKKSDFNSVTRLSVATTERWTDGQGNKQKHTEWHRVVAFNGKGETAAKYLNKGSQVLVEGKIRTNSWTDKETGEKRSRQEIIADRILFLDRKPNGDNGEEEEPATAETKPAS